MARTVALPQLPTPARKPGRHRWLMRVLRLVMLAAIVALLAFQADRQAQWRADDPVRVEEAAGLFPGAARVGPSDAMPGAYDVVDRGGALLGRLVRTMPEAAGVVGYRGPTDALLALDTDGTIVGMRLRRSADTPDHLRDVADDREFMAGFTGWRLHDLADYDNARALEDADIWPVSGATLTSSAVIDGVIARAKAQEQLAQSKPALRFGLQDGAIALWIIGGLLLMFTRLRRQQRLRAGFRVLVVVWHLGFGGGLIALSLLTGWAMHGPAWRTAPALVTLGVLMLGLPLLLGRNAYCQELCPHGIVQGWLRRVPGVRPAAVPKPVRAGLRWLAPGLLAIALVVVLFDLPRDLAGFEPFDAYPLWRSGGWAWGATLAVFVLGLAVSVRYPMAYCQHACPTGWLLRASAGARNKKRFAGTDAALLALLLIAAGVVLGGHRAWSAMHPVENTPTLLTPLPDHEPAAAPRVSGKDRRAGDTLLTLDGTTMRTTWRVVVLGDATLHTRARDLGRRIAKSLESVEAVGSVWSPGSDPDRVNHAAPGEWVILQPETRAMFATAERVQRQSAGAFNPALGRQVAAVGLGPTTAVASLLLREDDVALDRPAWELDPTHHRARRLRPDTVLDLGGVLQGSAADRVASMLLDAGVAGCLVEVGGEVCALGETPTGGWRVRQPSRDNDAATLTLLPGQALATSDTRVTTRHGNSHLIDPATGRPQPDACRVTVRARDAATADAWATALAAAGPDLARRLIADHRLTARYEWSDAEGQHVTDTFSR